MASKPGFGAKINWGQGISRNLCALFLHNEKNGSIVNNLVTPSNYGTASGAGTIPTFTGGDGGSSHIYGTGSGNLQSYYNVPAHPTTQDLIASGNPVSWFVRFKYNNALTPTGGLVERNDGDTVNAGWAITHDLGNLGIAIVRASADNRFNITAPSKDVWHNFVVTFDGNLTGTAYGFYLDGSKIAALTQSIGAGISGTDVANSMHIGNGIRSNTAFTGDISTIAIWRNRIVTQDDVNRLQSDPWTMTRFPLYPTISILLPGILLSLTDTITITDSIIVSLISAGAINLTPSDTLALLDSTTLNLAGVLSLVLNDSVSLSDSLGAPIPSLNVIQTDSMNLSDAKSLFLGMFPVFSDTLTLSDAIQLAIEAGNLTLSDSIALSDLVTINLISNGTNLTLADFLTFTDSIIVSLLASAINLIFSDTLQLGDALSPVNLTTSLNTYIRRYLNDVIR